MSPDRSPERPERRAYRVTGQVQGVGFRWSARRTATELGLRGTVRNDRDGSVEVEAEGAAAALDRFEAWLRSGPPGARVAALEPRGPSGARLPDGFEIIR